jgi:hypothetical protein
MIQVAHIVASRATHLDIAAKLKKYGELTPVEMLDNDELMLSFENDIGDFPHNLTSDTAANEAFKLYTVRMFFKRFYNYYIGQENPLDWYRLVNYFFNEEMPRVIKQMNALENADDWLITNTGHMTGSGTANAGTTDVDGTTANNNMAANADTPQNQLDFKLGPDPTDAYNFEYATAVNGAKANGVSHTSQTQKTDSTNSSVSDSSGRNASIMSLIQEYNRFHSGKFIYLWQKASRDYQLFSGLKTTL